MSVTEEIIQNAPEPVTKPRTSAVEPVGDWRAATPEQRQKWLDSVLEEANKEFAKKRAPKYTMQQVLGDFRPVEGKPGLYARPMCLEVELRAIELYEMVGNGTASGLARISVAIAASVLYRVNLPDDETEAREKILGYVRGSVEEEDLFTPLTEKEVGRIFRDTDELKRLVLDPLEMAFLQAGEEDSPNE